MINYKKPDSLVIFHHRLQQQRQLTHINHYLIASVFILVIAVFMVGFFIIPNDAQMIATLKNNQQLTRTITQSPLISAEIDTLKGELVGLVSGSIENKLRSLEEGIKLGSILGSLQIVENIRTEVKALHKYSDPLVQKEQQVAQANARLIKEVSHLKHLIYLTLGSCSLMFCAFLLIWIKHKKRLGNPISNPYLANISK